MTRNQLNKLMQNRAEVVEQQTKTSLRKKSELKLGRWFCKLDHKNNNNNCADSSRKLWLPITVLHSARAVREL